MSGYRLHARKHATVHDDQWLSRYGDLYEHRIMGELC
jgi:hypothetical protein